MASRCPFSSWWRYGWEIATAAASSVWVRPRCLRQKGKGRRRRKKSIHVRIRDRRHGSSLNRSHRCFCVAGIYQILILIGRHGHKPLAAARHTLPVHHVRLLAADRVAAGGRLSRPAATGLLRFFFGGITAVFPAASSGSMTRPACLRRTLCPRATLPLPSRAPVYLPRRGRGPARRSAGSSEDYPARPPKRGFWCSGHLCFS
jgi:hypothetical protein